MPVSNHKKVRAQLRESSEGLSIPQLRAILGYGVTSLRNTLTAMPDAYIDRWEGPYRGQYRAIWCVVEVPDNCPRPSRDVVAVRPRRRKAAGKDSPPKE
jgi:hypothetical protein